MCGIFGIFGKNIDNKQAQRSLETIEHRGKDALGKILEKDKILFHCLHAIVGHIKQPFVSGKSTFMTNCEIYNWKELNQTHNLNAKNDAELLFQLVEKRATEALDELDGVYAFFYQKDNRVILARDIIGEKPLCYIHNKNLFVFASEGKALEQYGTPQQLKPIELLQYNTETHEMQITPRQFFTLPQETMLPKSEIIRGLEALFLVAMQKRTESISQYGILFSGGIDSTLVAFLSKKQKKKFICYTAAFADGNTRDSPDLTQAKEVAKQLGFQLKTKILNLEETEHAVKEVIKIIETRDVVKVGVALPFYISAKMAAADGNKVLFSGLGSEELFAGYQRHLDVWKNKGNVNAECLRGLSLLWDRDLYRDDLITMASTIELRLPFLDYDLINYALSIPAKEKINATQNKIIFREFAKKIGVPEAIAERKKIAAQYGSNFDKALEKLAKKAGSKTKKEYLERL
ncbi:asparagine synthetase B [Candidatus Woesearchaeota archaeon]|nr:asparagine synthetase B [Candidatus Woesearchaeota archaeon]